MFKKIFILTTLLAFFSNITFSQAFKPGEKLEYEIYYGGISLGKAMLSAESVKVKDRIIIHAISRFATTGEARSLFAIDDIYESYFDAQTTLPLKFTANVKEEKYAFKNEVLFYHKSKKVKSSKFGIIDIASGTRDIISAFYNARNSKFNNLVPGSIVDISGFLKNSMVEIKLKYVGEKTITVNGNTYRCHQFSPMVKSRKMVNPEKDVIIYISADANKIPIRIEIKLPAGSFKADLTKAQNLPN